jgi:FtsP/CotA-like multicopper oxidase with cupredoxin domain
VTKINGTPVEPYWVDTIALPPGGTPDSPTTVTFRTRFETFTGLTVMHCHMLAHEDMGMMQAVDIV